MIQFFVEGEPIAQPRQRHFAKQLGSGKIMSGNYCPDNGVKSWKERLFWTAKQEAHKQGWCFSEVGAYHIEMTFFFQRPKSAPKKTSGLYLPKTSKPDLDNLSKAVLDALNKTLFHDDSQIVSKTVSKWVACLGGKSGVEIKLEEVGIKADVIPCQKRTETGKL